MRLHSGRINCWLLATCFALAGLQSQASPLLQHFVEEKEALVTKFAKAAAEAWLNRTQLMDKCSCLRHSCTNDLGPGTKCTDLLSTLPGCKQCKGSMVDFTTMAVDLAPGSSPGNLSAQVVEEMCVFQTLEPLMTEIAPTNWLLLGTIGGTTLTVPFRPSRRETKAGEGEEHFEQCNSYDPRVRPWYIAASTGAKDVVILLDVSLSMRGPKEMPKLSLAKDALLRLLETFTFTDYVNIVTVHNVATQLWEEAPLMQAVPKNLEELRRKVDLVEAEGGIDFNAGFERVFELLLSASQGESDDSFNSSRCTRHIIFLTDSIDCSRSNGSPCSISESEGPAQVLENIEMHQRELELIAGSRALIFTVSMGTDLDNSLPRQIACANQGAWSFVEEGDNPLDKMRSYYTYIAAGRHDAKPVWVYPYLDSAGMGLLTTVSKVFYAPDTNDKVKGSMLGVVGYDATLSELETSDLEIEEVVDELVKFSTGCQDIKLNGCQLQHQRRIGSESAACPDKLPLKRCYKFEGAWYMYFEDRLDWEKAKTYCKKYNGNLASVRTKRHLSLLASMSNPRGSWLGASRTPDPKITSFTWENGDIDPIGSDSQYWALPGPPHPGKFCALIDPRGDTQNMAAEECASELSFICEFAGKEPQICKKSVETVDAGTFYEIPSLGFCEEEVETEDVLGRSPGSTETSFINSVCDLGTSKPGAGSLACCTDC